MTKIKICGITNLCDAIAACELGADALGFVFAKSKRRISPPAAKKIIRKLPPFVAKVGVFVNESPDRVNKTAAFCGLDLVQLHGDESPAYCAKIKAPVIKAFRVKDASSLKNIERYRVSAWLLDAWEKEKYGGTGKTFRWSLIKKLKHCGRPVILSGGLGPANVGKAIKVAGPYAVDVSTGVEDLPGKKSFIKMKKFIGAAKLSGQ